MGRALSGVSANETKKETYDLIKTKLDGISFNLH